MQCSSEETRPSLETRVSSGQCLSRGYVRGCCRSGPSDAGGTLSVTASGGGAAPAYRLLLGRAPCRVGRGRFGGSRLAAWEAFWSSSRAGGCRCLVEPDALGGCFKYGTSRPRRWGAPGREASSGPGLGACRSLLALGSVRPGLFAGPTDFGDSEIGEPRGAGAGDPRGRPVRSGGRGGLLRVRLVVLVGRLEAPSRTWGRLRVSAVCSSG
jgi:hypothetical protein